MIQFIFHHLLFLFFTCVGIASVNDSEAANNTGGGGGGGGGWGGGRSMAVAVFNGVRDGL